jgi:multicomponent Na+:H+ antiporter subunit B
VTSGSGAGPGPGPDTEPEAGPAPVPGHEPHHRLVAGALLTAGVGVVLTIGYLRLLREHADLPAVARQAMEVALPQWKLTEPVNEVVYGTRGFDTFGETFLLLAAVISVILITRPREPRRGYFGEEAAGRRERAEVDPHGGHDREQEHAREAEKEEAGEPDDAVGGVRSRRRPETPDAEPVGTPAPERAHAMSVVVRTAVRVAAPVLAIAGLYLVAWGYSPGGGFPGGAVMLGVALLVYAGFGRERIASVIRPGLLETIEMAGAGLIIAAEALGLMFKGSFSANWLPLAPVGTIRSGGVAQLFSFGELIEVGTGLAIAVFAVLGMSHDWTPEERDEDKDGSPSDSDRGSTG